MVGLQRVLLYINLYMYLLYIKTDAKNFCIYVFVYFFDISQYIQNDPYITMCVGIYIYCMYVFIFLYLHDINVCTW